MNRRRKHPSLPQGVMTSGNFDPPRLPAVRSRRYSRRSEQYPQVTATFDEWTNQLMRQMDCQLNDSYNYTNADPRQLLQCPVRRPRTDGASPPNSLRGTLCLMRLTVRLRPPGESTSPGCFLLLLGDVAPKRTQSAVTCALPSPQHSTSPCRRGHIQSAAAAYLEYLRFADLRDSPVTAPTKNQPTCLAMYLKQPRMFVR
jgi:hypothetical protein